MLNSVSNYSSIVTPKYKQLRPQSGSMEEKVMPDGSVVNTDESGEIVFVQYASGIKVKRNEKFTMVSMLDGSYMFGSPAFSWLQID